MTIAPMGIRLDSVICSEERKDILGWQTYSFDSILQDHLTPQAASTLQFNSSDQQEAIQAKKLGNKISCVAELIYYFLFFCGPH